MKLVLISDSPHTSLRAMVGAPAALGLGGVLVGLSRSWGVLGFWLSSPASPFLLVCSVPTALRACGGTCSNLMEVRNRGRSLFLYTSRSQFTFEHLCLFSPSC